MTSLPSTTLKATFVSSLLLLIGCGGGSPVNIVNPPAVQAATPTPSPTPPPTPTPDAFPPAQPLVCKGSATQGGVLCDQSDGVHYYRHDQFTVFTRADGHGTFEVITESGIRNK